MPTSPPVYTAASLNCQWPGFASTRRGVANGTIDPWSVRLPKLVAGVRKSGADVIIAQELGETEAAEFADERGADWRYQRFGLAAILWHPSWVLEEEPGRDPVSRDWQLPAYGQDPVGRTLIAVRLRHQDSGQYFFAASCHFASNGSWGLANLTAATARYRQAQYVAAKLHKYSAVLIGGDFNSRGALPGTPRYAMQRDGWTFTEPPSYAGDPHRGIDAIGAKRRVHVRAVDVLQLGKASDHAGRVAQFTITNPVPKD